MPQPTIRSPSVRKFFSICSPMNDTTASTMMRPIARTQWMAALLGARCTPQSRRDASNRSRHAPSSAAERSGGDGLVLIDRSLRLSVHRAERRCDQPPLRWLLLFFRLLLPRVFENLAFGRDSHLQLFLLGRHQDHLIGRELLLFPLHFRFLHDLFHGRLRV